MSNYRYTCGKCGQQGHSRRRHKSDEPAKPKPGPAASSEPESKWKERIVIARCPALPTATHLLETTLAEKPPKCRSVMIASDIASAVTLARAVDADYVFLFLENVEEAKKLDPEIERLRAVLPYAYVVGCVAARSGGNDLDFINNHADLNHALCSTSAYAKNVNQIFDHGKRFFDDWEPEERSPPKRADKRKTGGGTWLWAIEPVPEKTPKIEPATASTVEKTAADEHLASCRACNGTAPHNTGWPAADVCSVGCLASLVASLTSTKRAAPAVK
jgi:hypothetical protein